MAYSKKPRYGELDIEKFTKKGNGLGKLTRDDGFVSSVDVPFGIPGDRVRVMLLGKRKGIFASFLEEVITPSLDRISPKCPHFGVCGGCRWQQMSYERQLQEKQQMVEQAFKNVMTEKVKVLPIIPCQNYWQYRNKMEYSFSSDAKGERYLGLVMAGGRGRVFNLTTCDLANPWFAATVDAVRDWWKESGLEAYHPRKNSGSLRTLTVREGQRTGDRMVNLTVSGHPDYALTKEQLQSFVAKVREAIGLAGSESENKNLSIFLTIHQAIKGMKTQFFEMHLSGPEHMRELLYIQTEPEGEKLPLTFHISPAAFFQPNTRQSEVLYSTALQMAEIPKNGTVYDLYCGTGTLGICAAKHAAKVIGIELSPEAVLDARYNAKINGVENITFLQGAVHEQLAAMRGKGEYPGPDLVVVDPPRVGLDPESIQHLVNLSPEKILYISCNPVTQGENIEELVKYGYDLESIQPVDQFPHTVHIENIAILKKMK